MCINSLMIENEIIQCLLDDLLDRICSRESSSAIHYSSTKSIEAQFNQSINLLNNSIKQFLKYELNTVVQNGQLTTTSNIRHSRYYNPATTIKQANDLKKKLHWIQQRQMIVQQLNLNQQQKIHQINCDVNSMEKIWFDQRLKIVDQSLDLLKKNDEENEINETDESSCARCRVYQRKLNKKSKVLSKLKQIHHEHNYFNSQISFSSPESDLIDGLSKLADRIGRSSPSKKPVDQPPPPPSLKKKPPKLQNSMSLNVAESIKTTKRTIEDSNKQLSNSNFISNHFDVTSKRQKRIASPQASSTVAPSPHEILTPTCRLLSKIDFESTDQQETEDISDESFIRRHIRCELEQETWLKNPSVSKNIPIHSNRKSQSLQTSLSVPNGLPSTMNNNSKQYSFHVTANGIAYTQNIESK